MGERDSSNTHEVIGEIFRAMNTKIADRSKAGLPRWADTFPYVNGCLFSGSIDVPRFSKIARSYLLHIGNLDWTKINPDIFGSMIQAVADDDERGELGMHYTSVPNILKVLNPLFLDDLRESLEDAGDNARKLLNLRKRISKIRVFDPACGSGNFLVIAYKQMREIENTINERRGDSGSKSDLPLTNFRGIELRDFSAEVARLALIIAEYQCDVTYLGQKEALSEFLPLNTQNWVTCGNALRLDWLSLCPPTGAGVKYKADDLFETPLDQTEIDFENEGGETYICGNPPYLGSKKQSAQQKSELEAIFSRHTKSWKSLDYVAGWFMKASEYGTKTASAAAFVSTNSINQGQQVAILWPLIFGAGNEINFAHTSFKWANLASNNAGVTVVIVGVGAKSSRMKRLFMDDTETGFQSKNTPNINAYLVPSKNIIVEKRSKPISGLIEMTRGNSPTDGGFLLLNKDEIDSLVVDQSVKARFIKPFYGSDEIISGRSRYCIWVEEDDLADVKKIEWFNNRFESVRNFRLSSTKAATVKAANWPHRFDEKKPLSREYSLVIPIRSSENRPYLPVGVLNANAVVSNLAFELKDAPLWYLSLIASKIHLVWIATVCARLELRFSYTNTLGWNTFPVPTLTEKNKADLTRCAEDILLAREAYFPATIADLYDDETMPTSLREAHERNDEVLERIFIGRRFKNDTERLEKLFEMYTQMTAPPAKPGKATKETSA